jgi:NAD(P)H-dependent FMN reductase
MESLLSGRQAQARRNDERVLAAARAVFVELGAQAPVSAIAERAGVGVGTLYRRYPTKEDLIRQLCVSTMERTIDQAAAALAAPDAWAGFADFVSGCVRQGVGTMAHLAGHYEVTADVWEIAQRLNAALQAVIDRAHREGPLRPGVSATDLTDIFRLLGLAEQRERLLALALDGLRGDGPLPGDGIPWDLSARRWRQPAAAAAPGIARPALAAGAPSVGSQGGQAGERLRVALIIGSVREGRFGPTVAAWLADEAARRDIFEIDVIDLADAGLPHRQQPHSVTSGQYPSPAVRAYAARIAAADAFVMITPEYNHGYPASLKLGLDSVLPEWKAKPAGFVSYGGISGGLRAVEQLRLVVAELGMVSIRETVSFAMARHAFGEDGSPLDQGAAGAAGRMLDQLAWWARALRAARAEQAPV